jgi:nicotinamide-nucleotide amidase
MSIHCAVISIGNEILLGKTVNSNLAWLGSELAKMGIEIKEAITIKDEAEAITEALEHFWERYDLVLSTGGLGPTEDDITKATIADYFGTELQFDDSIWDKIKLMFSQRGIDIPEINRSQAMVPQGFVALENRQGTAPGLYYHQGNKHFFALQGVPLEMMHVFDTQIRCILKAEYPAAKSIIQRTLHTFGISESALAEMISQQEMPEGLILAWLPQIGRVDLKLCADDPVQISRAEELIYSKISDKIWGKDQDTPASVLLDALRQKQLLLAVAESCTAGLLQAYIAAIPGASDVFVGGVITYANRIKRDLLGVDCIDEYGAVSAETAVAMVKGVQKLCQSDVAISITGIAGPDGGSAEKPVGTVHFAFACGEKQWQRRLILTGDRQIIRHKAAEAAMLLLYRILQDREI